ncbi:MTAP family purine nucleoside phosphorylase [Ruania halotolerans]|uniref:MTAP family purine nucleoside phosphorylase n=1 Tax=Ruania halotolerans TaxID=2897773 RepID=UPI001E59CDA3|nr:MTAP family purine nucleoside phosphorylase [Ruania halotolerans]UFU06317.1 MTAP family purine nucleoside phosphorylase [Ruania halotolerans]
MSHESPHRMHRIPAADPPHAPLVGVIGGTGLQELLGPTADTVTMRTPYGPPSAPVALGELAGRRVAFLPRHGPGHALAPHEINYRANIWALGHLGVRALVTSNAVGGLAPSTPPDTFVLPDQLIDRTRRREDTFVGEGVVAHVALADPYCPVLLAAAGDALHGLGEPTRVGGTVVVIEGPRFSTRAESRWFRDAGAHIINMTQYPEVALAGELGIGVVNLSYVTDTDAGDDADDSDAADAALVLERMARARPRIEAAVAALVAAVPASYHPRALVPTEVSAALLAREVR